MELPLTDMSRTFAGEGRTTCSCKDCTTNCEFMPGFLLPEDLERMRAFIEPELSLDDFARKYLLASPGATVARIGIDAAGKPQAVPFQVPTIVPTRGKDSKCVFLKEGRCSIHAVSPFGCAFFDAHEAHEPAVQRSQKGLHLILEDNKDRGPYLTLWKMLAGEKKIAKSANDCRKDMQSAMRLPFVPELIESAKERYAAAIADTLVVGNEPPKEEDMPMRHRKHVFDFQSGLRMGISKERLICDDAPIKGLIIHVSASVHEDSYLFRRLIRMKSPHAAASEFASIAAHAYSLVSGVKIPQDVPGRPTRNAMHWLIPVKEDTDVEVPKTECEAMGRAD